ncbi:hypothetical protein D3C76_665410 [compost metagenome]
MERRVAQHHIQRLLFHRGQAIARQHRHCAVTQRRLPILPRRLHRHVRLIDQGVVGIRVGQRAGNRQHAVAATQVGDAGLAQVAGQVREERAGADVQAVAAEHVGMVDQLQRRCIQRVAGGVG